MKKVLCLVVVLSVLMSLVTAFAANSTSEGMEDVLAKVKQKIDIPEKMTEFKPYTNEYVSTGEKEYTFLWQDAEGKAYIEVSCDEKGRIKRYNFYDNTLKSEKKLSKLSKEDILEFADEFLRKTLPETFSGENEKLMFDTDMWSVNNLNYSLRYARVHNGIRVKDNDVSVNIAVYDDVPYVRNMSAYLRHDVEFQEVPEELDGYVQRYKDAFPLEVIYKDDVQSYWKAVNSDEQIETVLIYRHKDYNAGYILASNGEVAEDDMDAAYGIGGGVTNEKFESSADLAYREEIFTEQEIAELDKVGKLLSKDECTAILKKIPHIKFDAKMKMTTYNIYRDNERYTVNVSFATEDNNRYIAASLDGETGEIMNIYNRIPYPSGEDDKEVTAEQKKKADKAIDEFLGAVAGDSLEQFGLQKDESQSQRVYRNYNRYVNGIRYISDGINVEYDALTDAIVNYNMDYEDEREFAKPDGIMESDKAYDAILENAPLKKIYVKTGGVYKVCYAVSEYEIAVDAFSGERYFPYKKVESNNEYNYSDIEGHWAKEMINKLAEVQIGLEGEKFSPDAPISQFDLLRLFAAGVRHKSYLDYSEEDLYREFAEDGIIGTEEKNPQENVKREDAFKYMVRLDGLEDVAKLYEIFKVEYVDGHLLTSEKLGYAAILTGMNIICGNGGRVRPDEPITRAEAAVMVYNYMVR